MEVAEAVVAVEVATVGETATETNVKAVIRVLEVVEVAVVDLTEAVAKMEAVEVACALNAEVAIEVLEITKITRTGASTATLKYPLLAPLRPQPPPCLIPLPRLRYRLQPQPRMATKAITNLVEFREIPL